MNSCKLTAHIAYYLTLEHQISKNNSPRVCVMQSYKETKSASCFFCTSFAMPFFMYVALNLSHDDWSVCPICSGWFFEIMLHNTFLRKFERSSWFWHLRPWWINRFRHCMPCTIKFSQDTAKESHPHDFVAHLQQSQQKPSHSTADWAVLPYSKKRRN